MLQLSWTNRSCRVLILNAADADKLRAGLQRGFCVLCRALDLLIVFASRVIALAYAPDALILTLVAALGDERNTVALHFGATVHFHHEFKHLLNTCDGILILVVVQLLGLPHIWSDVPVTYRCAAVRLLHIQL